jgi:hypothetical protein
MQKLRFARNETFRKILGVCSAANAGVSLLLSVALPVNAKAPKDFHNPPAIAQWFKEAKDRTGKSCCNAADGYREGQKYLRFDGDINPVIHFKEWEVGKNGYRVRFDDIWLEVEESQVVKDNPVGIAIVWVTFFEGVPVVRCFAPTSLS